MVTGWNLQVQRQYVSEYQVLWWWWWWELWGMFMQNSVCGTDCHMMCWRLQAEMALKRDDSHVSRGRLLVAFPCIGAACLILKGNAHGFLCLAWEPVCSHSFVCFYSQVSTDFVKSGEYSLEKMGVTYVAKAHIKSPFDPENKRVKGIYWQYWENNPKSQEKVDEQVDGGHGISGGEKCYVMNDQNPDDVSLFFWS